MAIYKVTIERVDGQSANGYDIETKIYQQTVEGDESIVPAIISQVLNYISIIEVTKNTFIKETK